MTDDENAKAQVAAFVRVISNEYGLSDDDIRAGIDDYLAYRKRAKRFERYGEWFAKAIIGAIAVSLVAGFFGAAWWSITHFIRSLNGH